MLLVCLELGLVFGLVVRLGVVRVSVVLRLRVCVVLRLGVVLHIIVVLRLVLGHLDLGLRLLFLSRLKSNLE